MEDEEHNFFLPVAHPVPLSKELLSALTPQQGFLGLALRPTKPGPALALTVLCDHLCAHRILEAPREEGPHLRMLTPPHSSHSERAWTHCLRLRAHQARTHNDSS